MTVGLDGTVIAQAKAATIKAALTTTQANDVIIFVGVSAATTTITAVVATGLTFTQRSSSSVAAAMTMSEWYAVATGAFSNTITATFSASGTVSIIAFGVSGANTTALFDSNAALPNWASVTAASITGTISTSFPNDFVFQVVGNQVTEATATVPAGFSTIEVSAGTMGPQGAYEIPSTTLSVSTAKWKFPTSRGLMILSDALQPLTQPKGGAGTEAGTHTLLTSQAETGAGQLAGTHSLASNLNKAGAGQLAGTHGLVSSQVESGEGQLAGTHTLKSSQVETGEGSLAGTHSLVSSQKKSGGGSLAGTHSAIAGNPVSGEGRLAGTHTLLTSQKETGAGALVGTHGLVSSQKEGGAGSLAGTHVLKVSQVEAGTGSLAGTHSLLSSQNETGEGRFAGTHGAVASGKTIGEGQLAGSGTAASISKVAGAGTFHATAKEVASQRVVGSGALTGTYQIVKPVVGRGGFGCKVTLFAFAGASQVPYAARQESGGVTEPTLDISGGIYAFNVNVLTNPITGGLPPPDGGNAK
jgi:hypothetical protein